MPTVEDDWPNFEPRLDLNTLPTEIPTNPQQVPQTPTLFSLANWTTEVGTFEYHGKVGDISGSNDSLVHRVVLDFKMNAGISRTIWRKFPTN